MADQSFTFSVPEDVARRADRGAPIVIRNAKLAVVKRTTLDASIDLPPGWYAAQAVLPNGQELEAAFELSATGALDSIELSAVDVPEYANQYAAPELADADRDDGFAVKTEGVPGVPDGGGERDFGGDDDVVAAGPQLSADAFGAAASPYRSELKAGLGTRRLGAAVSIGLPTAGAFRPLKAAHRWQFVRFDLELDKSTPLREGADERSVKIEAIRSEDRENRFLRIERPGFADLNLALPVSFSEGATYSFEGPSEDWGFELQDPDADLLFGYLGGGRVNQLAQLVDGQGPTWQRLFDADDLRPVAGVVGAYALLLVGDTGGKRRDANVDWSTHIHLAEQLAGSPQASSDAQAIYGEFLARLGRHDQALREFGRFVSCGLPICSIGLRLVIDRLLGYRSLVERKGLSTQGMDLDFGIRTLGKLADYVDFDQPILSFTTAREGRLGNDPHGEGVALDKDFSVRQQNDQERNNRAGVSEA